MAASCSHSGGHVQGGHVIRGLRTGLTGLGTLLTDRSGQARVGAWGVPVPGKANAACCFADPVGLVW